MTAQGHECAVSQAHLDVSIARLLGEGRPQPRVRVHPVRLKLLRRQADDRLLCLQFAITIARVICDRVAAKAMPVFGLLLPDRT